MTVTLGASRHARLRRKQCGSVATLIGLWVEVLERRYNWWSTDPPGWHYDWDAVPDFLKSTHAIG